MLFSLRKMKLKNNTKDEVSCYKCSMLLSFFLKGNIPDYTCLYTFISYFMKQKTHKLKAITET